MYVFINTYFCKSLLLIYLLCLFLHCLYLLNAKIKANYFGNLVLKQLRLSDKMLEFYKFLASYFLSLQFLPGWEHFIIIIPVHCLYEA